MMPDILNWSQIRDLLEGLDLTQLIKDGFVSYSNGEVVVPPVGELQFEDPPGETHIKYGYIKQGDYFVIKIASGFYKNPELGLSSSQGLMLVFDQKTGEISAILLDDGNLTGIRTAVAGLCTAQVLAPNEVRGIGILGTGIQARLQLQYLLTAFPPNSLWVYGRSEDKAMGFADEFAKKGIKVQIGTSKIIAQECNLIVTTTSAHSPILMDQDVLPGTHITAVGSDTPEKIEVDVNLLRRADIIVADSISQCLLRGEIHHALKQGTIQKEQILELGNVIADPAIGRKNDEQITIADLTGVAVQDIQIAKAVYLKHLNRSK